MKMTFRARLGVQAMVDGNENNPTLSSRSPGRTM